MGVKISDQDHGYKRLTVQLKAFAQGATVAVGVNSDRHEGSELANDELGAIHEFGLGNAPRRSFLRAWVDEQGNVVRAKLRALLMAAIYGSFDKGEALNRFGRYCTEGIRERIIQHIPPPLEDKTVQRKGGYDVPLIETAQLFNAVVYEVRE